MIKACVKKPFTVLVAVIVCLTLAAVSLTEMQTDLLPEMSMPYMVVVTTYPGASPEKVEASVTQPLEGQLGTVSRVKNVSSTSAENYSMVMLEFEDDTNMDSAMVKVNSAIQLTDLPEECGKPNIMEISMDMLATQYLAVDYEGKDLYQLSDFAEDTVLPYYQRQDGVATVSTLGLVEQSVEVRLNQKKIDKVNGKILAKVDDKMADAKADIDKAQKELDSAKSKMKSGQKQLKSKEKSTASQLGDATLGLNTALATKAAYEAELASEQANQKALEMELQAYEDAGIEDSYEQMDQMFATLKEAAVGEQAHDAIYDTVYRQFLVSAVQLLVDAQSGAALPDGGDGSSSEQAEEPETVTVTEDNVDSILAGMGKEVEQATKESVRAAAEAATQAQLETLAEQYPDSVSDALKNPEKLAAAQALLSEQGQTDAAAQLSLENLTQLDSIINSRIPNIRAELENLKVKIATSTAVTQQVTKAVSKALESYSAVEAGKILAAAGFGSADAQLATAKSSVESGQKQLDDALESFEKARETAVKNANVNALVKPETLSQLIYAQDFAMPAGYIDDKDDNQWMLKIGDHFQTLEELSHMLLTRIDGVGSIRLEDVADITLIDNAGESYSKVNGSQAVVLSVYKGSTASTSSVSRVCNEASRKLEEQYPGLRITPLMDQGQYIALFINNILHSMLIGAVLAIIVLIVFLKDALPTLVVAFSIPFSLLVSMLLMYFSHISLNMMSLGGLSLGIGMLVDNSIVVIENIYRLRGRGLTAPRAAVQGARQVNGAIIASTLTTICVFLPMIFTSGLTRQLMLPFALTIAFSLTASLVVALTVVPTIASVVLRRVREIRHPLYEGMVEGYSRLLDFCLRVKAVPLGLALALLIVSVVGIARMGVVLMPDMASDQIAIVVSVDDEAGLTKEESFALADRIAEQTLSVEGVNTVGALGATGGLMTGLASDDYSTFSMYALPEDNIHKEKQIYRICDQIEAAVADIQGAEVTVSPSAMGSMSAMLGDGLEINLYGSDLNRLTELSHDFQHLVEQVEGFEEVTNGQEEADQTLHLVINRDKAMKLGLTTAQIFAQISADLTTETSSIDVTLDGKELKVTIVDETRLPEKETLLNEVFETTVTDDDGEQQTEEHRLKEFGSLETAEGFVNIGRRNNERFLTVSAKTAEGYNTTKLTEQLKPLLEEYEMPEGYSYELSGEVENVTDMVTQMLKMMALGFLFIYLVMVAQFQSLLSPFIVIFTVPLAFTGGFLGLLAGREQLSLFSLMGFLVLMGTVVNNGIVFVDYTNQLRLGGLKKRDALIATGRTRMRPILMTAMTTILAMSAMVFDTSTSAGMSRGMALVVAGGLLYATLMTLFIIPVMYDLLYRKQPREVDVGTDEELEAAPDDAAEFLSQSGG